MNLQKDTLLSFTIDGDFNKFVGLEIDGNLVEPKYYDAVSGSTIITFKDEYTKTLTPGKHNITVFYTDGETEGAFSLTDSKNEIADTDAPNTNDDTQIIPWCALMSISAAGFVVLQTAKKD